MSRRVLVTGASRGIGRAIAAALGRDGFDVTVGFRSGEAAAAETVATIEAAGGRGHALSLDISDRDQCKEVLAREVKEGGSYWGVVCNAGITADAIFPAMKEDAWDSVLTMNLGGFYNVLRPLVMPMIRAREGGRIVTLSSVAGIMGNKGQVNYSAAKAGLIGATKALAQELASREITVNSVAPGLIETDMIEGLPLDEITKLIPLGRVGQPEEIAATVSFLLSQGAAYITSQVISVNGGMT